MKRYSAEHVDAALAQVQSGASVERHNAIVLAGEVLALREHCYGERICPIHAVRMYVDVTGDMECWHCREGRMLRRELEQLRSCARVLINVESDDECERAIAELRRLVEPVAEEEPT
jgi:hypothetical protein